jgi:NAD(P)H dehydrogenase (quinone)
MKRFLVVRAHPFETSLVNSAGDRGVAALRRSGHEVREINLHTDKFVPTPSAEEWRNRREGIPADLEHYADALRWATDLVLVYPTWFGSQPAILKGWFDRVWVEGVAYELPHGTASAKGILKNIKSIWVITTHGSSKLMNCVQGEGGKHFIERSLRFICSVRCRVKWIAFYGNDSATPGDRTEFLQRVSSVFAAVR